MSRHPAEPISSNEPVAQAADPRRLPVVILAGGLATRLRPLTQTIPKSLIEVNDEPFAFHQLRRLAGQGVGQVVFCLGHLGEQIVAAVGDGSNFGLRVQYSFDGPTLLGTAGALRQAAPLLRDTGADACFVLYGDSLLTCDFAAVQAAFTQSGRLALMTVFRNEGQWDTSNVEFAGGRIVAYDKQHRTPAMRHIDYGLGVLRLAALARVPAGAPFDLARLYQELLAAGQLAAHEVHERFYEIGSPIGLEETRRYLAQPRDRETGWGRSPGAPAGATC